MILDKQINKLKECPSCRKPQDPLNNPSYQGEYTFRKPKTFRRKTLYTFSWRNTSGYECTYCGYLIEVKPPKHEIQ